jgi:hypothetical protein
MLSQGDDRRDENTPFHTIDEVFIEIVPKPWRRNVLYGKGYQEIDH